MLYKYDDPLARSPTPSAGQRPSRTRILLYAFAFLAGVLGAGWFLRGDPLHPLTAHTLQQAKDRWRNAGVRDYDLRMRMNAAEYEVVVRKGIVSVVRVNGLDAPSSTWTSYSVDGLLATLELELDNVSEAPRSTGSPPPPIGSRVRFHPQWGYPERYIRAPGPLGRGAIIEVRSFQPVPSPP